MERDIVMIGTVMDAKSNWTVSFPPFCIGPIITHSPHLEVRKTEKNTIKAPFTGIKCGGSVSFSGISVRTGHNRALSLSLPLSRFLSLPSFVALSL